EAIDLLCNLSPRLRLAVAGEVVRSVRCLLRDQVPDACGNIRSKRQPPPLVTHHCGCYAFCGQPSHGADEVAALAHYPTAPHNVVPRPRSNGSVSGRFTLPIDAQGSGCLVLPVHSGGTVEHIVAGYMDKRQ